MHLGSTQPGANPNAFGCQMHAQSNAFGFDSDANPNAFGRQMHLGFQ